MIKPGIYPLSEGTYTIAGDHVFVPFEQGVDSMKDRPASLLVEIQPFLVVTESDKIIIDPGLGFTNFEGELLIQEQLRKLGIQKEEITKVLLSHLHIDHTGGVVQKMLLAGEWKWVAAFPNAIYYYQQTEWDYAMAKGLPSYDVERLQAMQGLVQQTVLTGDTLIADFIQAEICGGHTPFHQIFKIKANNKLYFFGGDVVPQFSQLQRKFVAKYDVDGILAASLRQQYAAQALQENWVFLFFHDLRMPYCSIQSESGLLKAVAIDQ
jgi:glyoxylase-like metal-dependent hydrolase (beta-lactamase superfamily II)